MALAFARGAVYLRGRIAPVCVSKTFFAFAALFFTLLTVPGLRACDEIPAGKSFWIRLLDPIASYSSKPGATIHAVLIQSPECSGAPVFPVGLQLEGEIISVHRVGLGFRHETAAVQLQFDRLITGDGETLPLAAHLVEIDNARESVRNGVIHGINATNSPQGRITSRLGHLPTFNPYSDWGLLVFRSTFSKLPEPEIYFPPGTDMRLQLNVPLNVTGQPELPRANLQMDEFERGEVETMLAHTSERTTTRSGKNADIINLLFVGSTEQVQRAFNAAGWLAGDHNSAHAIMRQFAAVLTLSNYPTMPITHQLLDGREQTLTFQKSFDSFEKREHLRLWSESQSIDGQQAWLGAYTRETSAALSIRYHNFIHHIDREVDEGVVMLIRDLSLAGCVESVRQLPRPGMPRDMVNSTGDEIHTDGTLSVVHLKNCDYRPVDYSRTPLVPIHPTSRVTRYIRNEVLMYKSDVIRGNIIYGVFDLGRMSIRSLHHRHGVAADTANLPLSPVSPDTLPPQFNSNSATAGR